MQWLLPTLPKLRASLYPAAIAALTLTLLVLYLRDTRAGSLSRSRPTLAQSVQFVPLQAGLDCPPDPYARAGMIYWGRADNDTRWVPFPTDGQAYTGERHGRLVDLDRGAGAGEMSEEELRGRGAAQPLMREMVGGGEWAWATGRMVLFVGSSHDRNNVENFCAFVGGQHTSWGYHTGGFCTVARLQLTVMYWFLFGIPEEYPWHAPDEGPPVSPERRIEDVMLPRMREHGLGQAVPDLVVVTSLFWDTDHVFRLYDETFGVNRNHEQGLTYQELEWHRSRAADLIHLMRSHFGADLPLMYRSRHIRKSNYAGGMLKIFQLDQGWRAVCQAMGVRVFPWGDKLEGYTNYYDDDQHFPNGPATWLFGDMMLFYLREVVVHRQWWYCLIPSVNQLVKDASLPA